jgi:hypothetical protein
LIRKTTMLSNCRSLTWYRRVPLGFTLHSEMRQWCEGYWFVSDGFLPLTMVDILLWIPLLMQDFWYSDRITFLSMRTEIFNWSDGSITLISLSSSDRLLFLLDGLDFLTLYGLIIYFFLNELPCMSNSNYLHLIIVRLMNYLRSLIIRIYLCISI